VKNGRTRASRGSRLVGSRFFPGEAPVLPVLA